MFCTYDFLVTRCLGKPATIDPNTAAWAAYYQQLYSQLSVPQSQQTIQAIAAQQPSLYGAPARTTVTPQPCKSSIVCPVGPIVWLRIKFRLGFRILVSLSTTF